MPNPKIPLEPEVTYHIFNHAVGNDNFFQNAENYNFFLRKIEKWILPVADIFAYCLMPNHFHFVVRIKDFMILEELLVEKINKRKTIHKLRNKNSFQNSHEIFCDLIIEQFSHCFNSYAQAYNKMYDRMGSLFKQSFQRKRIDSIESLRRVICYVHNNPVSHEFADKLTEWKYSSYNDIIKNRPTMVLKEEVIELYGGVENLILVHRKYFNAEI